MAWQAGQSGNPGGRLRTPLTKFNKAQEFRRSFLKLIQIRDGRIREMDFDEDGKRIWVYPSVANLIKACEKIMAYTYGLPIQQVNVGDEDGGPLVLQVVHHPNTGANGDSDAKAGAGGFSFHLGGSNREGE